MTEIVQKLKQLLARRREAYRQVFRGPLADTVLRDLAHFCRANESTFHDNERVQSKLDGRREVWLRIQDHLKLSPDQLWAIYDGREE